MPNPDAATPGASLPPSSRRAFLKHTALSAAAVVPAVSALRAALHRPSLALVTRGRSPYAIVVLPDAPLAARYGAEELQHHIAAMSGAHLPIIPHADVVAHRLPRGVQPGHFITLGAAPAHAPLPDEGFRLRTHGPTLAIEGSGARGTMYGCFALLEDVLGVRWFMPTVTQIPHRPTITLPTLNRQETPVFALRFPHWGEIRGQPAWCAHNRVNADYRAVDPDFRPPVSDSLGAVFLHPDPTALDARMGGSLSSGRGYMGGWWWGPFEHLVPPKAYPQFWKGGSLCLSEPGVVSAAVASVTADLQPEPTTILWRLGNDSESLCTCPGCAAINAAEGAPSGALFRFVNAVAAQLEPRFPHAIFMVLAYLYSEAPPKVTGPRRNVRVVFASEASCIAHPLGACDKNRQQYDELAQWAKLCPAGQLWFWNYSTNFSHFLQPLPNLAGIAGFYRVVHQLGGTGIFDEADDEPAGGGSFAELKAYLQAKLLWNPARDEQAIVREFVAGVYGAGAPYIQQWLDALEAEVSPAAGHGDRHAFDLDGTDVAYLPDALVARGVTLFDAAERAAAGDAAVLERIRKQRLGVEYMQFVRAPHGSPERERYKAQVLAGMRHFNIRYEHA